MFRPKPNLQYPSYQFNRGVCGTSWQLKNAQKNFQKTPCIILLDFCNKCYFLIEDTNLKYWQNTIHSWKISFPKAQIMFRLATETKFCFGRNRNRKRKEFTVSAKPNFGKNGRNSAESRNRICFGRTLFLILYILLNIFSIRDRSGTQKHP